MIKPSERIQEIRGKSERGIDVEDVLTNWIAAILDYLDEEAEKKAETEKPDLISRTVVLKLITSKMFHVSDSSNKYEEEHGYNQALHDITTNIKSL